MDAILTLPFEYNFDDYHEAHPHAAFLSNLLGVKIGYVELHDKFGAHGKNEAHQNHAAYRFRFDLVENMENPNA